MVLNLMTAAGEADVTAEELLAMLLPAPSEDMRAYPISTRGNSVKNDDEAILAPLDLGR